MNPPCTINAVSSNLLSYTTSAITTNLSSDVSWYIAERNGTIVGYNINFIIPKILQFKFSIPQVPVVVGKANGIALQVDYDYSFTGSQITTGNISSPSIGSSNTKAEFGMEQFTLGQDSLPSTTFSRQVKFNKGDLLLCAIVLVLFFVQVKVVVEEAQEEEVSDEIEEKKDEEIDEDIGGLSVILTYPRSTNVSVTMIVEYE